MPQSMIGILAMMIFSLFAVQQQKKVYITQNSMVRQAVSTMLNGAAVERLEEISSKHYDQATSDNELLLSPNALAFAGSFGPGNDPMAEDDVDDFHAATDTLYRAIGADSLGFIVYSEVRYASESDPEQPAASMQPTKFKHISVVARSLAVPGLPDVRVQRSVSCGSACQW